MKIVVLVGKYVRDTYIAKHNNDYYKIIICLSYSKKKILRNSLRNGCNYNFSTIERQYFVYTLKEYKTKLSKNYLR